MLLKEPITPSLCHAIFSNVRALFLLQRSFTLLYREYEVPAKAGEKKGSLIYIGEGESLGYIEALYFNGLKRKSSDRLSLPDFRRKIKSLAKTDSLIFIEVNRLLNFIIPQTFFLTFPWIRQRTFLEGRDYLQRKSKISSTFGRKVRKYGYSFRITRDGDALAMFYREFYLPYITNRFHELCSPRSFKEFRSAVRSGFLLQVFHGEKWVSGAICQVRGKSVTVLAFGVHGQYFHLLKHGVLSSVYYFVFHWAEETGVETVDLLRSRANAADGVYEHKRRWGALAERDPWPHTAIWLSVPDSAMIPSLLGRQFIWHGHQFVQLNSLRICR